MLTSRETKNPSAPRLGFVFIALFLLGILPSSNAIAQTDTTTPTTITISDNALTTNAKRLGVNLGTQDFWDSGLMMRNLTFRNPGFEGETWQTIMHCVSVTPTSCTDDNLFNYWPANFLNGGTASFIYGPATGTVANITTSNAAVIGVSAVTVNLSGVTIAPSVGDYIVVRMTVPGNAQAGWWTDPSGGATVTTDTTDLSPETPGKQALSLNASGPGQQLSLNNFNDGFGGHIFMKMSGNYNLSFRAKGTGGGNQVVIGLARNAASGAVQLWNQTVNLTNSWQDYSFNFSINNDVTSPGNVSLTFALAQSSMYIDDVALTEAAASTNPTKYRNAVVSALQTLHPGTLRYMDSGLNWGSSLDNQLAPDFARQRTGYSPAASEMDDIAMGLHDFLVLCQTVGAEPWYTMPTGMTTQEMSNLMDYLGGSTSTAYGAKRAALGQTAPWTSVFPQIHLEFGNEVWNTVNTGGGINAPAAYGTRAGIMFATAKASPSYSAKSFDLILDGFEAVSYWAQTVLANSSNYDTIDVASYNFNSFNDASSTENVFGPMFAEPEYMNDNPNGMTLLNASAAATAGPKPAHLAVYETNIDSNSGAVTQAQINNAIPSLGAGLAVAANMLLAQRDLGVTVQNMFAIEGLQASFFPTGTVSSPATTSPIWGVTIDMGGATDLRRPMYLSEELANMAILPTMFATSQGGANPTWNQAQTTNDNFALPNAHFIQSMAYSDGTTLNVLLFNLSRTSALAVNFAGLNTPKGTATVKTLTAQTIDANNETQSNVGIATTSQSLAAGTVVSLPPFSMTVLSVPAPYIAPIVTGVTATCANSALSPTFTTTCTASVAGQGNYNSAFNWSASLGTISGAGVYTPPATVSTSQQAVVTATSVGDTTKSASFTIVVAPDVITSVTPSCASTSVGQGKTIACTANVQGTGSFNNGYTWSTTAGSMSFTGVFTAPTTGTSVTLTATSTQDPTKSGKVTLSVSPVLVISNVTYSVTGNSITANWHINMPANSAIGYGTSAAEGLNTPYNGSTTTSPSITISGLQPSTTYYISPYSFIPGQTDTQYLTVTTSSGATAVTGVSVNCSALSLILGASTGCAATVSGTGSYSSAVTWSASAGTIGATGVLTAPTSGTSLTVTATSVADPAKSGSVVVSLTPVAAITGLSVTCQATSLVAGSTTTCSPTVTSTGSISTAVTFSASAGSITSAGVLTTPKTGTSVTVTATSVADPAKSASAILSLTPLPTITGVRVTCQSTSLTVGGNTACASSVTGTGSFTSAVTWSASAGSITSTGTLSAPATGTSVTVTATSTQDPTKSGTAVIALSPALVISNPQVTVTSTTVTVSWTLNNSQANSAVGYFTGSNASGITPYSATTTANPTFTLTGFAPSTPLKLILQSWLVNGQSVSMDISTTTAAASASVTGVSVNCSGGSVKAGGSTSCSAAVAGTGSYSNAVTWSASAGTISSTGLLTAPASGTSVVVKATSVQDPTKSATQTITVTSPNNISAVTVACPTGKVGNGAITSCSSSVAGTGTYSSAVTWSASAGSITAAGKLTTPLFGTSLTVTATSVQDPTKSGTATVRLVENLAILNPVISVTPTTIVVSWTVTEKAHNGVNYGFTTAYGINTPYQNESTTNPSFTFTGLKPGTTYQGQLYSYNDSGTAVYPVTVTTPLK